MKTRKILSIYYFGFKYSLFGDIVTAIFSMAPIYLIYYYHAAMDPFEEPLTFVFLLAVSIGLGWVFLTPTLVGGILLTTGQIILLNKNPSSMITWLMGGVLGVMVGLLGTSNLLHLTEDPYLKTWIFYAVMMLWDIGLFFWIAKSLERFISNSFGKENIDAAAGPGGLTRRTGT